MNLGRIIVGVRSATAQCGYLAAGYALDFKFNDDAPLIAGIVRTAE